MRRRTTMNFGAGGGQDGSGIPQPSIFRGSRASLAPSAFAPGPPPSVMRTARKPESSGLFGTTTPARGSRGLFGGGNPPMSNTRMGGNRYVTQTPATNRANRRISVFASSRRTTMGIAVPGTATRGGRGVKDPRPLKDKAFQARAQQTIVNYLSANGYPGILTPKTLSMPTVKDFETIFKFLYAKLDPRYVYQKKFPEDALLVLQGVRYPYVGNISKSHIYSAGSLSTWPGLLAMLLWLVELIEAVGQMGPPDISSEDINSLESSQFVDRVFFDYLSQAYPVWLDSGEEPQELEETLANQFHQKNAHIIEETQEMERKLKNAKDELDALLNNESPLVLLERERVDLITDKEKFENYVQKIERKRQRMVDVVSNQKQLQDAAQVEQMALEKEKREVQEIVDAQQISTEDVDRMNAERNQLLETLSGVQNKAQEAEKELWTHETKLQRVLDEVESLVQEYMSKAYKLGFVGSGKASLISRLEEAAKIADTNGSDESSEDRNRLGSVDIDLHVDTSTDDPQKMVSVDLCRTVKPTLQHACDVFSSQMHSTQNAVLELREKIDKLYESRMEQENRVEDLEKQVKRQNEKYRELREIIMAETRESTAKIERLEADISSMKRDISQGELQSKAALTHAESEWENVQRGCRLRRAEVNEDVVNILEDAVYMMTHTQDQLKDLSRLFSAEGAAS